MLFFLILISASYFYQGGFSNQNSRFDFSLALGFEHQFNIDTWHLNTIDKAFQAGHYYSEKAPLTSYLALPVTGVASLFWNTEDLRSHGERGDLLLYLATVITSGLLTAMAMVLFRRILLRLNPAISPRLSFIWALLTFAGTPLFTYSTLMFGHAVAAAFLMFGLYQLLLSSDANTKFPERRWSFGSFLLGLAVFGEFPVAVLAVAIFISALMYVSTNDKSPQDLVRRLKRRIFLAAVAGMIPGIFLALHNWISFGSPFSMGYGQLSQTIFASQMNSGFYGITAPDLQVAAELLFGNYRGLFIYAPILLVALFGFIELGQQAKWLWPILCGSVALVLVNSSYGYWQGGVCFGPRHLVPVTPFIALGFAGFKQTLPRLICARILGFASIFINILGVAVTPFINEFDTTPLVTYFDMFRGGMVSISPITFFTPISEAQYRWNFLAQFPSASLNFGEWMGLPGAWSLAPLLFLGASCVVWMYRHDRA